MSRQGGMKIAAALMMLPGLSGCVAAVAAIPVLAGGGMVVSDRDEGDDKLVSTPAPRPPFANDAADRSVASRPPALAAVDAADVAPAARRPVPELPAEPVPEATASAEAPALAAPVPAVAAKAGVSAAPVSTRIAANPYDAFYSYASGQARLDPVSKPRSSAILATPGSLSPIMSDCAILPPAVLIDLDPIGGPVDLDKPATPNAELAEALAALRAVSTEVFWISSASAAEAGKLRERLLATGLDPWGRDGLLLMRRADDRKQLRRRELSETHCVVAIAGDKKGDFDELFDYLKNPAAAASLDTLVGEGWFITPPPFEAEED